MPCGRSRLHTDSILELLESRGLTVAAILNTHGHADYIAGNASMKQVFPDALSSSAGTRRPAEQPEREPGALYGMPQ